jgi:hypothetical protein
MDNTHIDNATRSTGTDKEMTMKTMKTKVRTYLALVKRRNGSRHPSSVEATDIAAARVRLEEAGYVVLWVGLA